MDLKETNETMKLEPFDTHAMGTRPYEVRNDLGHVSVSGDYFVFIEEISKRTVLKPKNFTKFESGKLCLGCNSQIDRYTELGFVVTTSSLDTILEVIS